jgi:tRNA pseudouridine38-40 synthase
MTLFDPPDEARLDNPVRARLLVAYDGTEYHGFAENPGVRTVAGALRDALERLLGHRVELSAAGRTDRGVHAWGQVVSFDARADRYEAAAVQRSLNKLLGPAVAIRVADVAPPDFDARFSARARIYRYRVCNRPVQDPFRARFSWHVAGALDLAALRQAADPLVGDHDFTSFCRRPDPLPDGTPRSLRRRVRRAAWHQRDDDLLEFEIEADAFCHQMVRSIVGTLVDVGLGRRKASDVLAILGACDRGAAGRVAPPQGLTLWAVRY